MGEEDVVSERLFQVLLPEGEGMDAGQEKQQTSLTYKSVHGEGSSSVSRKGRSKDFINLWPLR